MCLSVSAQCPDSDSLWRIIAAIPYNTSLSPVEKEVLLFKKKNQADLCGSNSDSTYAYLLRIIGHNYSQQSDFIKAVQYFRQSIDLMRRNIARNSINPAHLISSYYWLSIFYDSLNNRFEKQRSLDSCITIATQLRSADIVIIRAMYAKVEYLFGIGDYYQSIDYARNCRLLASLYANSHTGKDKLLGASFATSSLNWEVNAHLAVKNFETAASLLNDKIQECKKTGQSQYLGTLYAQSAGVYYQKGDVGKTLLDFSKAFSYEKNAGNTLNCKIILNDIGYTIYFKQFRNYPKALEYYHRALAFNEKLSDQSMENAFESLNVLNNIAEVYVQMRIYDSAFHYFKLAYDQIRPGFQEEDLISRKPGSYDYKESNDHVLDLMINKGDACLRQFQDTGNPIALEKALRIFMITDRFLDKIRLDQSDLKSRLFWRNDSRKLYELAIEASYLKKDYDLAFYFFEKSRAVLLSDHLNEQKWIGSSEIMKQTQISKKINSLEDQMNAIDTKSSGYADYQKQLFDQKRNLYQLEESIRQNNPLYFQSYLDTGFINPAIVRKKILSDHQALIELFIGDRVAYSLIITSGNIYMNKIDRNDLDSSVQSYSHFISNQSLQNNKMDVFIHTSWHLYMLIFRDISLPEGRIVVSNDGPYFPFEALVASPVKSGNQRYFLQDHAVSYTYSARYLLGSFGRNASAHSNNLMGMAPVHYRSSFSLNDLPGSDGSLKHVGAFFNRSNLLIAGEATKQHFQNQFANYRIVQLYTHASDSSAHGDPVIYFSDSALYLSDLIPEITPQTKLIVLSACETGNGRFYKGEGVFSFNRGFASMGIPSSVINLWSVDNISTYRITELFYKFLSDGLPIDVALQKAKLEFILGSDRQYQLPYYWAATVLAGKTDAVVHERNKPWKDLLIVFGLLALSFFVLSHLRIKRK